MSSALSQVTFSSQCNFVVVTGKEYDYDEDEDDYEYNFHDYTTVDNV